MPEDLARHGLATNRALVDADGLRARVDADDAWAEAGRELLGEVRWDRLFRVQREVRDDAV